MRMLTPPAPPIQPSAPLAAGRDALDRGAWDEARTHLTATIAEQETPEALEDLGLAAWWLDEPTLTFDSRERAYVLYRERQDSRGAARVAIWLVWDYLAFRGDFAVASGWLERARRLLVGRHDTAEYGWLMIREAEVALFRRHDPSAAIASAARAAKLGRELADQGVEFTALGLEGLARVSAGDVDLGMRRLDEASIATTAGEVKELHAVGLVSCWQIFACERIRDYDRAAQWVARVQEFTRRWGLRPLSAICRTQYAGVLIWHGDWTKAEEELAAATRELQQARPALTSPPVARLGVLRLRQGRFDDAERLFEQSTTQPQSRVGIAELALERGHAAEAAALLDQYLAHAGDAEPTARASALELLVRAHTENGALAAAKVALQELERIAAAAATASFAASVAAARGVVQRHQGDLAGAATHLEHAADLFQQNGAPFETARTRLDLAEVLIALGRTAFAEHEARLAMESLDALGAEHEANRGQRLLRSFGGGKGKPSATPSLTGRQLEILRFIARGSSNSDIAVRLKLSEHTVKRHVANLLSRLDLSSRAAAAAYATREGLI
ncbi:MAG TPA: LuxR C-terminal-related transcriptional regulator [Gemmatimonadaceae bacterium]|nr:LuxR C-terminal-related transcriptional regulator [Gemmatimonadaceae bacterium]